MNLSNIFPSFPPRFWIGLSLIGKHDWLRLTPYTDGTNRPATAFSISEEAFREIGIEDVDYIQKSILMMGPTTNGQAKLPSGSTPMGKRTVLDGVHLTWLDCLSKFAAHGPKMFRPTFEQCEAMEQVEINLPIRDYAQPYPAMLIEFPTEYVDLIAKRYEFNKQAPRYLMVRLYDEPRAIFTGATFNATGEDLTYFFQERQEFPTIEHALRTHVAQEEAEERLSETMSRVALNLMLLLCNHPTYVQASNPGYLEKVRNWQRKNPKESNEVEMKTHLYYIGLQQEIVVRRPARQEDEGEEGETGPGSHASPHPHWRKGHWRNQACGPRMVERKRVLIKPCFVRGNNFRGDLGETSATYRG